MADDPVLTPAERLQRAESRYGLRDYAGALEDYTRLVEIEPTRIDFWIDRAKIRMILNDTPGAVTDLKRATQLDDRNIRAWYYRGLAEAPLDPPAARESYTLAVRLEPADAQGYYYRGLAQECLNRHKEAAADFTKALELTSADHPERHVVEAKAKAYETRTLAGRFKEAPVTWILSAINIAVMLVFWDVMIRPTVANLLDAGALERTRVWQGEYWRLFTCMFLHVGWIHLFWNIYAGFWLCSAVEQAVGCWRFLGAYVLTGLGASAASLLCHASAASAGASGALFGVEGIFLMIFYHRLGSAKAFFADRRMRRILWITAIWFVLGMTVLPMDNYAHLGGLFFGLLLGWLFLKGPALTPPLRAAVWVGILGLLAATCVAAVLPWYGDAKARNEYPKSIEGKHVLKMAPRDGKGRAEVEEQLKHLRD